MPARTGGLLEQLREQNLLPEGLCSRSREVLPQTPAEAMALFAGSGLVLAMRLHGLILAAVSGAPVAALSYDPKVQAAARALGCPVHDLAEPSNDPLAPNQPMGDQALPDRLLAAWQACLDHPPSAERLAQLRQAGGLHAELFSRCQG